MHINEINVSYTFPPNKRHDFCRSDANPSKQILQHPMKSLFESYANPVRILANPSNMQAIPFCGIVFHVLCITACQQPIFFAHAYMNEFYVDIVARMGPTDVPTASHLTPSRICRRVWDVSGFL